MLPSQKKIEKLIKELQNNQTETPNIDGKLDIALSTSGDKAYFIRHIAALANNLQESYLIIGVEDKTWIVKGLSEDSPLKNPDSTQQTMNQILANRLDPALSILYRTYKINDKLIGLVLVNGDKPPYIISVENAQYGGNKSHGKQSFVYRGIIYTRQGANSIAANRQSLILQIVSGKIDYVGVIISLTFMAAIIGGGVGVGASILPFGDPWVSTILGFIWGLLIGWILSKRVIESLGNIFEKIAKGTILKGIISPTYGALIGTLTGYNFVDTILKGKMVISHPIIMGLIIGPIATVIIVGVIVGVIYSVYYMSRKWK